MPLVQCPVDHDSRHVSRDGLADERGGAQGRTHHLGVVDRRRARAPSCPRGTAHSAIRRLLLEPPQRTREPSASSAAARPPSGKAAAEQPSPAATCRCRNRLEVATTASTPLFRRFILVLFSKENTKSANESTTKTPNQLNHQNHKPESPE